MLKNKLPNLLYPLFSYLSKYSSISSGCSDPKPGVTLTDSFVSHIISSLLGNPVSCLLSNFSALHSLLHFLSFYCSDIILNLDSANITFSPLQCIHRATKVFMFLNQIMYTLLGKPNIIHVLVSYCYVKKNPKI